MRLIDADKLMESLHESLESDCDLRKDYEFMGIDEFIENQPTAYDIEHKCKDCAGCTQWKCDTANVVQEYRKKLIEQLEDEQDYAYADFEGYAEEKGLDKEQDFFSVGMKRAIEIVKGGINGLD